MNLGDLSSVVQLGVGLHAGTALLQNLSEFASTPLSRKLDRLKAIADSRTGRGAEQKAQADRARDLLGDLEVFKVHFFHDYQTIASVNTAIAICLAIVLSLIALFAQTEAQFGLGLLIIGASLLPGPLFMVFLWNRWRADTRHLREAIDELNANILRAGSNT